MSEGGVDDPVVRNAEDEFLDADAGQQIVLRPQPVVRRIVQLEDRPQMIVIVRDAGEHAIARIGVDRKSTRLNFQSLMRISYAVFCLKKKMIRHITYYKALISPHS